MHMAYCILFSACMTALAHCSNRLCKSDKSCFILFQQSSSNTLACSWETVGKHPGKLVGTEVLLHNCRLAIKGQPDVKYQARLLKDMFCDPVTFLYIHFATPVVQDFEKLNYSKFQANNPDPNELMQDLDLFKRCLIGRSLEKNGTPRQEVDLGRTFKQECDRYVSEGVSREEKSQKTACVRAVQERYIV